MQSDRIAVSNLRPSVIAEKCLVKKKFISKYMVFLFFPFYQRRSEQENVRFIINEDTGLNIIL
jgi:hypothetical protein